MANLYVDAASIRGSVISNLEAEKQDMIKHLNDLSDIVMSVREYAEGDAFDAFTNEFNEIISVIYRKLNVNLERYEQQLESLCQEFDKLDADIAQQLKGN